MLTGRNTKGTRGAGACPAHTGHLSGENCRPGMEESPGFSQTQSLSAELSWTSASLLNQTHKLNHAELISLVSKNPSIKVRLVFEIFPPREWVCLKVLHKLSKRKYESFWFLKESYKDSRTHNHLMLCARVCLWELHPSPGPVGQSFRGKPDPPHGHFLPLLPTLKFSLGKFSGSFSMIVFLINSPCTVFELFNSFIAS